MCFIWAGLFSRTAVVCIGLQLPRSCSQCCLDDKLGCGSSHSTKVGRIFFTLGALREAGAAPGSNAGTAALQVMSKLQTVEHLFAVAAEGNYMLVDGSPVPASAPEHEAAPRAPLDDPAILTTAAQQISAVRWAACDALAMTFRRVCTEPEPELEPEPEPEPQPQPEPQSETLEAQTSQTSQTFRVDVKCGSHGGRAKSSVRRMLGLAVASGVAATTGWEPVLSSAGVMVCVFLSLTGNSRTPQLIAGVRLTTVPLGTTSLNSTKADAQPPSKPNEAQTKDDLDLTATLPPRPAPRQSTVHVAAGKVQQPFRVLMISLGGDRARQQAAQFASPEFSSPRSGPVMELGFAPGVKLTGNDANQLADLMEVAAAPPLQLFDQDDKACQLDADHGSGTCDSCASFRSADEVAPTDGDSNVPDDTEGQQAGVQGRTRHQYRSCVARALSLLAA